MKTKIIFFAIVILPFISKAQNNEIGLIRSDSILNKIYKALPLGWEMHIIDDKLIIERTEQILDVQANRFDSPLSKLPKSERIEYIKANGVPKKSRIVYRAETKWDKETIEKVNNSNTIIYEKMRNLPEKYQISNLKKTGGRNSSVSYLANNDIDRKKINNFELEKASLEKGIKVIPSFKTSNYSVFFVSHEGYDDENHYIYPDIVSVELFTIENLFRELCIKH